MKTKRFKIILIFILSINSAFSVTVYAGDDIELAGDILQFILPVTAGSMALYKGDKDGVIQFSKSLLTTLGATYALKYTIDILGPVNPFIKAGYRYKEAYGVDGDNETLLKYKGAFLEIGAKF